MGRDGRGGAARPGGEEPLYDEAFRDVVVPYRARSVWLGYHASPARWRVVVAHRRAGKTVAAINGLIRTAVRSPLPNRRRYACAVFVGLQ